MATQFGFCFGGAIRTESSLDRLLGTCELVEELDFDSLWFFNRNGPMPPVLDLVEQVARRTDRITIGPHVLIAPGLPPHPLAQRVARLQQISNGRFVAGLGLGGPRERLIQDLVKAAAALEEIIAEINRYWYEEVPADQQKTIPRPPIWLGGYSPRACRRVAAMADGWVPSFIGPAEFGGKQRMIQDLVERNGNGNRVTYAVQVVYVPPSAKWRLATRWALADEMRRHKPGGRTSDVYVFGGYPAVRERVEEFRANGADHLILIPARPPRDLREEIRTLHREVVEKLR